MVPLQGTKYDVPQYILAAYESTVEEMLAANPLALRTVRAENTRTEDSIERGALTELAVDDPMLFIATLERSFRPGDTAEQGFHRALEAGILETVVTPQPAYLGHCLESYFHNGALRYTYSHMEVVAAYGSYEPPSTEDINNNTGMARVYNMRNRSILADVGDWNAKAQFFIDEAQAWFEGADINRGATPSRVINNVCMALACKKFATSPPPAFEFAESRERTVDASPPVEASPKHLTLKDIGRYMLQALRFWK